MDFYSDPLFKELLSEILKEEYAIQRGFPEKDLETICQEVEADSEIFLGTFSSDVFSQEREKESFERVKSLLCLLLSYLELNEHEVVPQGKIQQFVFSLLVLRPQSNPHQTIISLLKQIQFSKTDVLPAGFVDKLIAKQWIEHVEEVVSDFLGIVSPIFKKERDRVVRQFLSRADERITLTETANRELQEFFKTCGLAWEETSATRQLVQSFKLLGEWDRRARASLFLSQVGYLLLCFGTKSSCLQAPQPSILSLSESLIRLGEIQQKVPSISFEPGVDWVGPVEAICSRVLAGTEEVLSKQLPNVKAA